MSTPTRLPFDNDRTLLYKWAAYYRVPIVLMVTREQGGSLMYDSIPHIMETLYLHGIEIGNLLSETLNEFRTEINESMIHYLLFSFFHFLTKERLIPRNEGEGRPIVVAVTNFLADIDPDNTFIHPSSINDLALDYDTTYQEIKLELARDKEKLRIIEEVQKELEVLSTYRPIFSSPLHLGAALIAFHPSYRGSSVTPLDGLDIFNEAVVYDKIPYIQYNGEDGKTYHKVYKDRSLQDKSLDYSKIVIGKKKDETKIEASSSFYIRLWLGGENDSLYDATKESLVRVEYHLKTNYLTIDIPFEKSDKEESMRIAIERVKAAFPTLSFGPGEEAKIKGSFNLYDISYDEASLLHIILTDPLFNTYLYIEESTNPFPLKRRIDIHYKSLLSDNTSFVKESYITNPASVSITISLKTALQGEIITVVKDGGIGSISSSTFSSKAPSEEIVDMILENDISYITINIIRADTQQDILEFLTIFKLLMLDYETKRVPIEEDYKILIPPPLEESEFVIGSGRSTPVSGFGTGSARSSGRSTPVSGFGTESRRSSGRSTPSGSRRAKKDSKIARLQEKNPVLFASPYSRQCQVEGQPAIIDPADIEWENGVWISRTSYSDGPKEIFIAPFTYDGVRYEELQIMPFPKDNPEHYIVCLGEKSYPGVQENSSPEGSKIYPFVPCCFKMDQTSPDGFSNYNAYYKGSGAKARTTGNESSLIKTMKILTPRVRGELPTKIKNALKDYKKESSSSSDIPRSSSLGTSSTRVSEAGLIRYGTPISSNSLLHAVCMAIKDPDYESTRDQESYISNLRIKMSKELNPSLLRQELYDRDEEEIRILLRETGTFLDPSLFYRAIEETFNINIYVFGISKEGEIQIPDSIILPRYRFFHSRPRRDRATVLILKHIGSEFSTSDNPQCDLIGNYDSATKITSLIFGKDMSDLCHTLLSNTIETFTWNISHRNEVIKERSLPSYSSSLDLSSSPNKIEGRYNMYNILDYTSILGLSIIFQYVDGYGKTRALVFEYVDRTRGEGVISKMLIIIPPTQPENFPSISDLTPYLRLTTIEQAISVFGTPISIDSRRKKIYGLWYSVLDIVEGIYVPIGELSPTKILDDLPVGSRNPLEHSEAIIGRVNILYRTINIITQIMKWMFELIRREAIISTNVFFERYVQIYEGDVLDSATFYNPSLIPHRLPDLPLDSSLQELGEKSGFFRNGYLIMYNQEFSDKMKAVLRIYEEMISTREALSQPPRYIEDYFTSIESFRRDTKAAIFLSRSDMNTWIRLNRKGTGSSMYKIFNSLTPNIIRESSEPILYQTTDTSIVYIVQNVKGGDRGIALNIAKTWNSEKRNIGSKAESLDSEEIFDLNFKVYIITSAGKIEYKESSQIVGGSFLSILRYDKNRYAALLPLV